jgi:uncharacterized coiled-coil protein SlyX
VEHARPGQPRQPNGWGDYHPADYDQYHDEDNWSDDYGETAGGDEPDPWGDTYPDAAYPADSNNHTRRDDAHAPQPGDPAADSGTDNGQPDESPAQAADSENVLSPEQERIHALETENADARHTIADLQEKNAAANQQIADLKADKDELTARLDLIEQHPASNDGYQDRETRRPDHGADGPDGPREENRTRCSTSA